METKIHFKLWEPPTLNKAPANQRRPWQFQRLFVCAPLATTYKDAGLQHTSCQSQDRNHLLLCNSSGIRFPWKQTGTKHNGTVEAGDSFPISA
jgi:hypothetical protein